MFERFTEDARRALFFSRYEASHLGSSSIDVEHILLGLLREPKGLFGRLVARIRLDGVREEIRRRIPVRPFVPNHVEIPFSPQARRALEATAEEAATLGHGYIGREHMLLGLLKDGTSGAGSILAAHGLQPDDVRRRIVELLSERADAANDAPHAGAYSLVDVASQIDRIKTLVTRLASAPADSPQAGEIVDRIHLDLELLKRYLAR